MSRSPRAETGTAGILTLVAPALVQAVQEVHPRRLRGPDQPRCEHPLGVIAIAATNGFHGYGWGIVLTGVIGVAQAVYTIVNQAFSGKLSKDHEAEYTQ
ncbi:hypothetical protein [Bifidobacterium leontopitheci]|uniref:Uncharacterized protein n=1 Tax=Bifidobacterium leontopitheci TaxID=2650774 RepID=A0A6I1GRI5_9BIFI|nr:hypothetical protein F7D09_0664 [Bifidobacterium leontopitheci]